MCVYWQKRTVIFRLIIDFSTEPRVFASISGYDSKDIRVFVIIEKEREREILYYCECRS